MDLTAGIVRIWIESFADEIETNKDYLTALDGPIGDNDHGINMDRGLHAVRAGLPADEGIDATLKGSGMTLIRTVGGASGPLYGTIFLRMAQAAAGHESLDTHALGEVLAAGRKGIVDRGKAEPGDKTMLDTWDPAVCAYEEAAASGGDLPSAVQAAARAAEEGMKATVPLEARKGRASYLGERSVGHQDPGATSSNLFFKALKDAVHTSESGDQ